MHRYLKPWGWRLAACLTLAALAVAARPVGAQSEAFPKDAAGAYRAYEVDVEVAKWLDGPVEYIVEPHERETWKALRSDEERKEFITWFWGRRDLDTRDEEHPYRREFYDRVAHANQRFRGFPAGWRSDRGRVWITLGPPTGGLRQTRLDNYGRCSAENGEWWTYYTQSLNFNSNLGEFNVVFVEERVGQYRICDPSMLGLGAWPTELQRAFTFTVEASVVDALTEFEPGRGVTGRPARTESIIDAVASVEALTVPIEGWGKVGVGGAALIPIELPLRNLLFEPREDTLVATLLVEATLVGMGEQEGRTGQRQWTLELDANAANTIGGASMRTALVLPSEAGGYSVRVRLVDPLSAKAWAWDGAVEISGDGAAASPPLVGNNLARLRDGGEVAILAADLPVVVQDREFEVVSWVRGAVPDAERVAVTITDATGVEYAIATRALWGQAATAGPLVVLGTLSGMKPGTYMLRLSVGEGIEPVMAQIKVQ